MANFLGTALGINPNAWRQGRDYAREEREYRRVEAERAALAAVRYDQPPTNIDSLHGADVGEISPIKINQGLSIASQPTEGAAVGDAGLTREDARTSLAALATDKGLNLGGRPESTAAQNQFLAPVAVMNRLPQKVRDFYNSDSFLATLAKYPALRNDIKEQGFEKFYEMVKGSGKLDLSKVASHSAKGKSAGKGLAGVKTDKAAGLKLSAKRDEEVDPNIYKATAYSKTPRKISEGTRRKLKYRDGLLEEIYKNRQYAEITGSYSRQGATFLAHAKRATAELAVVDAELVYLQAMRGIQDLNYGRAERISKILSMKAGREMRVIPRTDGGFNLSADGATYREGVSKSDLVHELKLMFNSDYAKLTSERAAAIRKSDLELRNELLKIKATAANETKVTKLGVDESALINKGGGLGIIKPTTTSSVLGDGTTSYGYSPLEGVGSIRNATEYKIPVDEQ